MRTEIQLCTVAITAILLSSCMVNSPPAPAPKGALSPTATEDRKDGTHRTFIVQRGDEFSLLRATGAFAVVSISTNGVTLDRGGPTSFVVTTGGTYHVGNHEYLNVNTLRPAEGKAEIEVHTRKLHPIRDALSF